MVGFFSPVSANITLQSFCGVTIPSGIIGIWFRSHLKDLSAKLQFKSAIESSSRGASWSFCWLGKLLHLQLQICSICFKCVITVFIHVNSVNLLLKSNSGKTCSNALSFCTPGPNCWLIRDVDFTFSPLWWGHLLLLIQSLVDVHRTLHSLGEWLMEQLHCWMVWLAEIILLLKPFQTSWLIWRLYRGLTPR